MRYLDLAERLRARLADGTYAPGRVLDSESHLAREFAASRVTVRRALETLREQGLVTSRQGSGWFVTVDPVRQSLGRVTTVEAALEAAGVVAQRRVIEFAFVAAAREVAAALDIDVGAEVLRVLRVNLADGEQFALVTVWVRAALGAGLSRADVEQAPFYDLLPLRGVELGRATQTIGAELASADDATLLGLDRPVALLVCRRCTHDRDGNAVLYSEHRYPALRTHFEIDFPSVAFTEARPLDGARHG